MLVPTLSYNSGDTASYEDGNADRTEGHSGILFDDYHNGMTATSQSSHSSGSSYSHTSDLPPSCDHLPEESHDDDHKDEDEGSKGPADPEGTSTTRQSLFFDALPLYDLPQPPSPWSPTLPPLPSPAYDEYHGPTSIPSQRRHQLLEELQLKSPTSPTPADTLEWKRSVGARAEWVVIDAEGGGQQQHHPTISSFLPSTARRLTSLRSTSATRSRSNTDSAVAATAVIELPLASPRQTRQVYFDATPPLRIRSRRGKVGQARFGTSSRQQKQDAKQGPWRDWISYISSLILTTVAMLPLASLSTSLPSILQQLQADGDDTAMTIPSTWILSVYPLTIAVFQTSMGNDAGIAISLLGRNLALTLGLVVFSIGSIVCATATDTWVLLLGRGIQGIGAGGMHTIAERVACEVTSSKQGYKRWRRSASMVTVGVAALLGPTIGGVLAEAGDWQWIFWIK